MAYSFASSSTQYLSATNPVGAAPLTMAVWQKSSTTGINRALVSLNQNSGTNRFVLYFDVINTLRFFVNSSAGFAQASGGSHSVGVWQHCCAVEAATNSRIVYLNGTAGTTETTTRTPASINAINIGTDRNNNTNTSIFNGEMAEVGVWSAALTAAEVASLAKGMTCDKVRPQSLVFYAPLVRDLQDVRGGLTITNNNTATVAVHPRVYA